MGDTSPEEIAERVSRDGALVVFDGRVLIDRAPTRWNPNPVPMARDVHECLTLPSNGRVEVIDGMCRAEGHWLPWENHMKTWCFVDDDPFDAKDKALKDALVELEAVWKKSR